MFLNTSSRKKKEGQFYSHAYVITKETLAVET